ncbi:protein FAR1-RELATED SEQUENCE 9-like [Chenopodium quinoa]|uniref:protein FAR1-RELATED SEQUENCE 9-like n=1 Tax=Chenopodium quinoa TaxID=63459 RepID=UPI000B770DE2|nr:protein FAR1-RELATED SEQUENCE 9-like [Chenopodium quinoa]
MTEIKGQEIEAMQEFGLRPMESFNYMSNKAGREDAIGHTVKDHMYYCYKLKIKAVEGGDSQVVCDKLHEAYSEDPNLFFRVRLDADGMTKMQPWQQKYPRFGVLKSDDTFNSAFTKCLSGCINEAEFEVCWDSMTTKYKLKNDSWFKRLYSLKHKWSTSLSKDFFFAGILSSQRSESTNHAVRYKANKKTSLTEFYNIFQKTVKTWRRNEDFYEFNSTKSIPTSSYPMSALLKHAADVYTHTLFRDFEEEFNRAIGSQTKLLLINGGKMVYQVYLEGRDCTTQVVTYDQANKTIQCPCKNFEESGWLCFHSLRILHMHSVEKIPQKYISFIWTKMAKVEVCKSKETEQKKKGTLNNFTPWRLHKVRKYYSLILKSHKFEQVRKALEESFTKDSSAIDEIISAMNSTNNHFENTTGVKENSEATSSSVVQVLDPTHAKTKGRQ